MFYVCLYVAMHNMYCVCTWMYAQYIICAVYCVSKSVPFIATRSLVNISIYSCVCQQIMSLCVSVVYICLYYYVRVGCV